jgi:ribonuclease Y
MNIVLYIVLPVAGIVLGWIIRWIYARFQLTASEQKAERVKQDAIREAEAQKKEILLNAKDELIRERNQQERENRERRAEVQRFEARVNKKEELLDQRAAEFEKNEKELADKKAAMVKREEELSKQEELYRQELEKISGLSQQEAKDLIIKNLENDARHDAQALINKIEQEAQLTAEKKAKDILVTTIQRIAPETTSDITVATVSLPSDEMKGRIIGREGRNIRAIETATGVDLIIDDTPEAVILSCFDPVRREVARITLEKLIVDGRIHPSRIEEMVVGSGNLNDKPTCQGIRQDWCTEQR